MIRQTVQLLTVVCVVLALRCHAADADDARLSVPSQEAQTATMKVIRDVYESEYDAAKSASERVELARRLFQDARDAKAPVEIYTLMRVARDIASGAGDAALALQIVDDMAQRFAIDTLSDMATVAAKFAKSPQATADAKRSLPIVGAVIDQLLAGERFELAEALAKIAINLASKTRDKELVQQARERCAQVEAGATAFADVAAAIEALLEDPRDADAKLRVGKYQCFVKREWDAGFRLLAESSDQLLRELAKLELAGAESTTQQLALGDKWWSAAESSTDVNALAMRQRAASWYRAALPKLTGISRLKVERRLAQAPAMASTGSTPQVKSRPTDPALEAGLKWLIQMQNADGNWSYTIGPNPGALDAPASATAMALLPFLEMGYTHKSGPYQDNVQRALAYIGNHMKVGETGGSVMETGANLYGHALATIAICKAYQQSNDKTLKRPAQLAVDFIVYCQDPVGGGWRYSPRQPGDTSVLGWQLTALMLAKKAGLNIPPRTLTGAGKFLDSVQGTDGASYGYTSPGSGTATTSIGLLSRLQLGTAHDDAKIGRGAEFILAGGPSSSNVYYNYYSTRLLQRVGGDSWQRWQAKMTTDLRTSQDAAENPQTAGSWTVRGGSHVTARAGRLGCTVFNLLTLAKCTE